MKHTLILILIFTSFYSFSQEKITISGRITDIETQEPLGFASIGIKGKSAGTISNADGEYLFVVPEKFTGDTLMVSYLGYEVYFIPVADIKFSKELMIALKKRAVQLDEVVVKPYNALELFRKAKSLISQNYELQPVMMQGFYREIIHENNQPYNLVEAVMDIHKSAYGQSGKNQAKDQLRIVKARQAKDTSAGKLPVTISEGPNLLLMFDYVKTGSGILKPKEEKNYVFDYAGVTTIGGREAHKITFDQHPKVKKPLLQGTLYIDSETFAFVQIDEKMSEKGKKYAQENEIRILGVGMYISDATKKVTWQFNNGKWYLSHSFADITMELNAKRNFILVRAAPELFANNSEIHMKYNIYVESVITQLHHLPVAPIPAEEIFNSKTKFTDYSGDDTFWENFNVIKSTNHFEDVARRIKGE
jgi:hypothetical protein